MKNDGFKIMSGFFIGAIGGLLTGILIAPESGKDTRKKISDTANKIKDDLSDFAEETLETTKQSITETIDDLVKSHKEKDKTALKN
jgi:gas vesicle protein